MVALYAAYLIQRRRLPISPFWINLSTYTFGIYIFQQFILQYIYYHTDIRYQIGIGYLPWIAFVFTLIASLLLAWLMRKTRVGKFLLG